MKKWSMWILLSSMSLSLVACGARDEAYYRVHPKALQDVIADCPQKAPLLVSCDVLHQIALHVNDYVYELRMSPQGYGQSILSLQEKIAQQERSKNEEVERAMNQNKQELQERLAVVSWLESPAS